MDDASDQTGAAVVPAVYGPHPVTCFRSLSASGIHTIGAHEYQTPARQSRHCDEAVTVPAPTRDIVGYKDALRSLAERESVRAIYPMRESDIYVLSKYRPEFESAVDARWPEFETIETVHDKVQLVDAAREADVATPATAPLPEADDWTGRQILKARYSVLADSYTEGVSGVEEPSSAVQYLDAGVGPGSETASDGPDRNAMVQEYVPGEEYAFWALYDDGEPVATCQKHQVRGRSYTGGTSVYRKTVDIPALEAAGRRLLDHLDWNGFASVQFVRDRRTGEFTLLEINPRVWVSMACPVRAGMDFPLYYWNLANGESVRPPAEYETGLGTHRIGGEGMYIQSLFGDDDSFVEQPSFTDAGAEILTSLYRQPNFDYLTYDDPQPFVEDLSRWLSNSAVPALAAGVKAVSSQFSADRPQSGP